jgi:hypothetical protein
VREFDGSASDDHGLRQGRHEERDEVERQPQQVEVSMEEEKKPYQIVDGGTIASLEIGVALRLAEGYVPLGGVQVVAHVANGLLSKPTTFYQAMVFNEA